MSICRPWPPGKGKRGIGEGHAQRKHGQLVKYGAVRCAHFRIIEEKEGSRTAPLLCMRPMALASQPADDATLAAANTVHWQQTVHGRGRLHSRGQRSPGCL